MLTNAGILDLEQLVTLGRAELALIPCFGTNRLEEVINGLSWLGLELGNGDVAKRKARIATPFPHRVADDDDGVILMWTDPAGSIHRKYFTAHRIIADRYSFFGMLRDGGANLPMSDDGRKSALRYFLTGDRESLSHALEACE